jgi:hypothetical protein
MWSEVYVLEVVKFITFNDAENSLITNNGYHVHVSYMREKFKSKLKACSYYDRHNPHMRRLNANGTYTSELDPITKLVHIVRNAYILIM